jgi:hypothetical protein
LDTRAVDSTQSFTHAILNSSPLPEFSWSIDPDGAIRVTTVTAPSQVLLWQSHNPAGRDFRNSIGGDPTGISWDDSPLAPESPGVYVGNVTMGMDSGAKAFMIELTFPSPIGGNPYVFTTEVRVVSDTPLVEWPFFMPTNEGGGGGGGPASGSSAEGQAAVAFALAVDSALEEQAPAAQPSPATAPLGSSIDPYAQAEATELLIDDSWIDDESTADDASDADAIDFALAGLEDELVA